MRNFKTISKQYFKRTFSLPAANYKLASYHHDQCERSLRMNLFSIEKRDLALVLTLFLAFGAQCMIIVTIAPQAYIFDTVLISKSNIRAHNSYENSSSLNKQPPEVSIDMDLEPLENIGSNYRSQGQEIPVEANKSTTMTSTATTDEKKQQEENNRQVRDEYESFIYTKPLNNFNKYINLNLRTKFNGILRQTGTILSLNKILVNFKINFIFETFDSENNYFKHKIDDRDIITIRESVIENSVNDITSGYSGDATKTFPPPSPKSTTLKSDRVGKLRAIQQLNMTFDCEFTKQQQTKQSNNSYQTCEIPDLTVKFKITHSKNCIYKITFKITEIEFKKFKNDKRSLNSNVEYELKSLDLMMLLSYTNSSFVLLTIFTRLILLIVSLFVACCFIVCLSEFKFKLWSLEQKWTALLLILLVGANKPLYILEFTNPLSQTSSSSINSEIKSGLNKSGKFPVNQLNQIGSIKDDYVAGGKFELVDSILDLNFICGLLIAWSCFAHSIRQMSRPFMSFYAIKLSIVGSIWILAMSAMFLANQGQLQVTSGNFEASTNALWDRKTYIVGKVIDIAFYCALLVYFANLTYHYVKSYIELKSMSYFKLRFKIQSYLCATMLLNYFFIIFLISTEHSPDLVHKFVRETTDVVQEMDYGKTSSGLGVMKGHIHDYDNQDAYNQSTNHHQQQYFHQHIKSNLKDNSIIEITLLSQNGNNTGIVSMFPPHSIFKHFYPRNNNNNNLHTSPITTTSTGIQPSPCLLTWLPSNYLFDSSCAFLCYIIMNNLYVLTCAYFYWPVVKQDTSCGAYLPSTTCENNAKGYGYTISGNISRQTNKEIDSQQ